MIVTVEGEQLDGFHIEHVPQINRDDQFDKAALSSIAGMRAVWLLYWLGRWEHLEDLGVNRTLVEPVLVQCCSGFGEKLTHRQARQLQSVPAMVEASRELRLAYALKNLDNQGKGYSTMEQTIYHAEVPTVEEAKVVVQAHGPEIEAAGGTIEYGSSKGAGSIVMVKLPASLNVQPENLLPTSGLRFSKVRAQVVAVPQNHVSTNEFQDNEGEE